MTSNRARRLMGKKQLDRDLISDIQNSERADSSSSHRDAPIHGMGRMGKTRIFHVEQPYDRCILSGHRKTDINFRATFLHGSLL
jgi:hypothetical protein